MNLGLAGRLALISGAGLAASGVARALAGEGVHLALTAPLAGALHELAAEVARSGAPAPLVIAQDLTVAGGPQRVREHLLAEWGRLDILVNEASAAFPLPLDAPEAAWEEALARNYIAVRQLTHAFLPTMLGQQWGRILHLTGCLEPAGPDGASAATGALLVWSKGLSREVARSGITVNALVPGPIASEAPDAASASEPTPAGCAGEPADIGYMAAFLASPLARYISGEVIHVDGGLRRFAY